jgi:F0F1-type ATP synthase delta subunit
MRYSPKIYARAFSEAITPKISPNDEVKTVKKFLTIVRKNGDWGSIKKILTETDKVLRDKFGRRKILIEVARDVKGLAVGNLRKAFNSSDIIEERIDANLIAGVKITVNDDQQFDGSLKRKLDKLFVESL